MTQCSLSLLSSTFNKFHVPEAMSLPRFNCLDVHQARGCASKKRTHKALRRQCGNKIVRLCSFHSSLWLRITVRQSETPDGCSFGILFLARPFAQLNHPTSADMYNKLDHGPKQSWVDEEAAQPVLCTTPQLHFLLYFIKDFIKI